ncbi:MAG: hypothetical protein ACKPJJ_34685, partial [Planctomycetaceae bacterium]
MTQEHEEQLVSEQDVLAQEPAEQATGVESEPAVVGVAAEQAEVEVAAVEDVAVEPAAGVSVA